ncbi:MAG: FdhF/YdeP family oxidoreductase, partial [Deltaproteobacteria bacterium]|nr:FdhF/YdeP family oxidoreductase [Deltaproteobacteria bacterium]
DHERSIAEFCENGAKAIAEEGTSARITDDFFAKHSVAELSERSDFWLGKQGRLTHPMVLKPGATHYEPLSWDDAFALLADKLNALASPNEALFYTSGRTSNEAAFLYQLFAREYGTNNLPDCSNMCHESSGSGLGETIGIGKGTVKLDDFDKAQVIVVIGQNPGTNHPRMLTALQRAKRFGARIISINPLPEAGLMRFKHPQELLKLLGPGTQLTDLFLQVRINGDVALLQGLGKAILEEEAKRPGKAVDQAFVRDHTEQFEAYAANVSKVSWDEVVLNSGLDEAKIREAAKLLIEHERIIFCWAMGLTQHENAVDNIREIVNVLLLRGAIGKPGAGACPVRGHSNVQGDRTMGIYEKPKEAFLKRLDEACEIQSPRAPGFDVVEAIHAMHEGKAKVFVAMGGNFLSATPDTEYTAAALRKTLLTAHVSTKLNRAHLVAGETALILPCLGRTERDAQPAGEQFVTTENSMGVVQMSRGRVGPASEHLLSEPRIVARLAEAVLGARSKTRWRWLADDYDRVRNLIEKAIPGFDQYNARVRKPGGFYLPNGPREGKFPTASAKARFSVHPIPRWNLAPGQLLMMTIRTHDQYNTTIYGLEDRYRGLSGERRVILMNREDIASLGLRDHQTVDLTSHFRGEERVARRFVIVPYDLPRGSCATYFPEANVLVPSRQVAHTSGTPASKSVVITLAPAADSRAFDHDRTPRAQGL